MSTNKFLNNTLTQEVKSLTQICPKCGENCTITNDGFFIKSECEYNHKLKCSIKEFEKSQIIKRNKIICKFCSVEDKDNTFCYCLQCNIKLCKSCKDHHILEKNCSKKIIDYIKFIRNNKYCCMEHNELFTDYCSDCKKDICCQCLSAHNSHSIIEFNLNKKEIKAKLDKIEKLKEKVNSIFYNIFNQLENALKIIKETCDIIAEKNRNIGEIRTMQELNNLKSFNIDLMNEKLQDIINKNNNEKDILKALYPFIQLSEEMTNPDFIKLNNNLCIKKETELNIIAYKYKETNENVMKIDRNDKNKILKEKIKSKEKNKIKNENIFIKEEIKKVNINIFLSTNCMTTQNNFINSTRKTLSWSEIPFTTTNIYTIDEKTEKKKLCLIKVEHKLFQESSEAGNNGNLGHECYESYLYGAENYSIYAGIHVQAVQKIRWEREIINCSSCYNNIKYAKMTSNAYIFQSCTLINRVSEVYIYDINKVVQINNLFQRQNLICADCEYNYSSKSEIDIVIYESSSDFYENDRCEKYYDGSNYNNHEIMENYSEFVNGYLNKEKLANSKFPSNIEFNQNIKNDLNSKFTLGIGLSKIDSNNNEANDNNNCTEEKIIKVIEESEINSQKPNIIKLKFVDEDEFNKDKSNNNKLKKRIKRKRIINRIKKEKYNIKIIRSNINNIELDYKEIFLKIFSAYKNNKNKFIYIKYYISNIICFNSKYIKDIFRRIVNNHKLISYNHSKDNILFSLKENKNVNITFLANCIIIFYKDRGKLIEFIYPYGFIISNKEFLDYLLSLK